MSNGKLTGNMKIVDMIACMSEGNPGAKSILIEMIKEPQSFMDIISMDGLDIRGYKIWMLYNDCCEGNLKKMHRTLEALRCGAYSQEEIHGNLGLCHAIPFLDDSIIVEGVPSSYDEYFGTISPGWNEYINANKNAIAPKIHEFMEQEQSIKRS